MKILMVCLGNICRSPLAEGILLQKVAEANLHWQVDSAGTNGYHVNEAPHLLSQKVAKLHGIDISQQVCRRFTIADFDRFDIIYAMAEEVIVEMKQLCGSKYNPAKINLLMNILHPGQNEDVPDPWYGPEAGYENVYEMIEVACAALIEKNNL